MSLRIIIRQYSLKVYDVFSCDELVKKDGAKKYLFYGGKANDCKQSKYW